MFGKNKIERQYRHGDILLNPTSSIPSSAKKTGSILAKGETTGHAHRARGALQVYELAQENQLQPPLLVQGKGELIHEEHGTIPVADGTYNVVRQREYSPQANRMVQD